MFGIGFTEMVLIGGIALVVIGPEKFPDFAKLVIRTVRDLRGYVDDVKGEVTRELTPIKREMDSLSRIDPEKYIDSLTSGEAEDEDPGYSNPAVNEEDRKIMAAADADTYDEDPYGWQEGEDSDYSVDKGAYPEDTVGYGEAAESDESAVDAPDDAAGEAETDRGEGGADAPDLDLTGDSRIEVNDPGEPDVWTGR